MDIKIIHETDDYRLEDHGPHGLGLIHRKCNGGHEECYTIITTNFQDGSKQVCFNCDEEVSQEMLMTIFFHEAPFYVTDAYWFGGLF